MLREEVASRPLHSLWARNHTTVVAPHSSTLQDWVEQTVRLLLSLWPEEWQVNAYRFRSPSFQPKKRTLVSKGEMRVGKQLNPLHFVKCSDPPDMMLSHWPLTIVKYVSVILTFI